MLVVPTILRPSVIHGLGVFAASAIARSTTISRYMPPFDVQFPPELLAVLSLPERNYLLHYAYRSRFTGLYVLPGDNDRYMNHSERPNVEMNPDGTTTCLAVRDIAAGEELSCDYRAFDADWMLKLSIPVMPGEGP